jgi:hypothetical protein
MRELRYNELDEVSGGEPITIGLISIFVGGVAIGLWLADRFWGSSGPVTIYLQPGQPIPANLPSGSTIIVVGGGSCS